MGARPVGRIGETPTSRNRRFFAAMPGEPSTLPIPEPEKDLLRSLMQAYRHDMSEFDRSAMATPPQRVPRYRHPPADAPGWASTQHVYRPRRPTTTPLYPVVQHHLETFLALELSRFSGRVSTRVLYRSPRPGRATLPRVAGGLRRRT